MNRKRFKSVKCVILGAIVFVVILYSHSAIGQDTVAITEFMNESLESEITGEWTELFNYGDVSVNLHNWTISDEDGESFTLQNVTINPKDFIILARDKPGFEAVWFAGVSDSRVVHISVPDSFRLGSSGDELILKNSTGTEVWKVAYMNDETLGRATFLAENNFITTVYGSKSSPSVRRNGNDLTGSIGYEGNDHTEDGYAYTGGNGDIGSPLLGDYGTAAPEEPSFTVDVAAAGQVFNPGVRGMAIADNTINRSTYWYGIPQSLEVSTGSSLRGVAAGLYADLYDWRVRNNEPRPTTLEFLRYARNTNTNLVVTANTRGLVEPDPNDSTKTRYYTTDITTLSTLAANWVRYVNHIVPTYRQGDTISDPLDAAIYSSLVWSSTYPGDSFDTLLAPEEDSVSKVIYWEIGNEPSVSVAGSIGVSNGFSLTPTEYYDRYKAIAAAMKAENPTIKVGPCIINGDRSDDYLNLILADTSVPVDFISYHPYGRMGDYNDPVYIEAYLGEVYYYQYNKVVEIRDLISANGRDPNSVEMIASETNVSYWSYNDTEKEGQMAHALGSVDTMFAFARLGLTAAHYWIWPAHAGDGTKYPSFKAFEKMRDYMGDTYLGTYSMENRFRIYVTRSSSTGLISLWILNFSNSIDQTVNIAINNIPQHFQAQLLRLENPVAPTTLFSSILSPWQTGGPKNEVDWSEVDLGEVDFSDFEYTAPAATLTLLMIENDMSCVTNWQY